MSVEMVRIDDIKASIRNGIDLVPVCPVLERSVRPSGAVSSNNCRGVTADNRLSGYCGGDVRQVREYIARSTIFKQATNKVIAIQGY
mgnify:CR=1 FL=1